jgi:hypothetical protein
MKAALRAPEKAHLLRELAEAYRLTAGGSMPAMPARDGQPSDGAAGDGAPSGDGARKRAAGR